MRIHFETPAPKETVDRSIAYRDARDGDTLWSDRHGIAMFSEGSLIDLVTGRRYSWEKDVKYYDVRINANWTIMR